jgi:hypothetical protein
VIDRESPIAAGQNRMPPITMTTLAAILTLLPLAFAIGQGSVMQQPLAIAIISGFDRATAAGAGRHAGACQPDTKAQRHASHSTSSDDREWWCRCRAGCPAARRRLTASVASRSCRVHRSEPILRRRRLS